MSASTSVRASPPLRRRQVKRVWKEEEEHEDFATLLRRHKADKEEQERRERERRERERALAERKERERELRKWPRADSPVPFPHGTSDSC